MAEPAEVDGVMQVTGLTPSTPAAPEPVPAAPTQATEEARPAEQPAAAETEVSQETTDQPGVPGEQVSRETGEATQEGEPAKKPSRGVQKALDRLTREREEARLQNQQLSGALAAVLAQLQQQPRTEQSTKPAAQIEQAPKREDYPDWEQFNRATAQWEARQASTQVVRQELGNFIRTLAGAQAQNVAQGQAQALTAKLQESTAKGAERFSDWDDVVVASDAPMSPSLAHAITLSEDPALVMHHLGVNPGEHDKLLRMTPEQQLYHVGRIVASAQPQAVVSKAPAPARPVGGNKGGSISNQPTDSMTAEQWKIYAKRNGLDRGLR